MSSRHGLVANPQSTACEAVYCYISFSHFDLYLRLCRCLRHHNVIKLIPFALLFEHFVMMSNYVIVVYVNC
jgi:hypothetical protein